MTTQHLFVIGALTYAICTAAQAQVPNTFQPGQPARAAEVNANFQFLQRGVAASINRIQITPFSSSADGVSSASCPTDSLAVSASCNCDSVNGSRNFGVLFGCNVAGNGAVGACFAEGTSFDVRKPIPLATVTVRCLSGATTDGTPLTRLGTPDRQRALSVAGSELEQARIQAQRDLEVWMSTIRSR